jgi:DNA polymerase-3 subunit delta
MKLYVSQINILLSQINDNSTKALLLYGPDKGYIDKICKIIKKNFNLEQHIIEYSNIASIDIILNEQNFFNARELVKIIDCKSTIDANLKKTLASNFLHFPIFIADELPSTSSLRKFFEIEKYLVSLACYHDNPSEIEKLILKYCNKASVKIDNEALLYLKNNLEGDHNLIISEIVKILYFVQDTKHISLEDAQTVVTTNIIANGDELCIYFAEKNYDKLIREFEKLKEQNINEVLILRALVRYYTNLYLAKIHIKNGKTIDEAVKLIYPPIFYKYIADFKKILSKNTIEQILDIMQILLNEEKQYKLNPYNFDIFKISHLIKVT